MLNLSRLPQVQAWSAGSQDFSPSGFMMANVTVSEAAVLSTIFWPDFVEFQGCVFLDFKFDEKGVNNWLDQLKGDLRAVEAVVNQVHLWDVFAPTSPEEYEVLSQLAGRVSDMWRAAARLAFPDREFQISVTDDPEEYGPTLTLMST
jgi:hypothetical protein